MVSKGCLARSFKNEKWVILTFGFVSHLICASKINIIYITSNVDFRSIFPTSLYILLPKMLEIYLTYSVASKNIWLHLACFKNGVLLSYLAWDRSIITVQNFMLFVGREGDLFYTHSNSYNGSDAISNVNFHISIPASNSPDVYA